MGLSPVLARSWRSRLTSRPRRLKRVMCPRYPVNLEREPNRFEHLNGPVPSFEG